MKKQSHNAFLILFLAFLLTAFTSALLKWQERHIAKALRAWQRDTLRPTVEALVTRLWAENTIHTQVQEEMESD